MTSQLTPGTRVKIVVTRQGRHVKNHTGIVSGYTADGRVRVKLASGKSGVYEETSVTKY